MKQVNCLEFRRALGADPTHASPASLAHRAACATCEKYAQDMLRLNGLIKRALEVPVPTIGEFIVPQAPTIKTPAARWYAMAASLFLMIGLIGAVVWLGLPRETLAKEAMQHIQHELQSMRIDSNRVASNLLDGMLRAHGWHLTQNLAGVSYLQNCEFRGHSVPHLVVQTERGPVTVLVLPEEKIAAVQRFDEQPYHGMLAPLHAGGIAVIAADASALASVTATVGAAIAPN